MDRPITVNLLTKEELIYEVEIRDKKPKATVDELRSQVRELFKIFPADEAYRTDFDPESELAFVTKHIQEIKSFLNLKKPAFKKFNRIRALAHHIFHRLSRIDAQRDRDIKLKEELEVELDGVLDRVDSLFGSFKSSFVQTLPLESPVVTDAVYSSSVKALCRLQHRYDGRSCVHAYIQRLEERCDSHRIPEVVLFQAAAELFTDNALIWFRSIKSSVTSWSNLKSLLIEEFTPVDYDDRLLEEIRKRTQGVSEPLSVYISTMLNYFSRLSSPLSENEMLKIVRNNFRPNIISALSLESISSLSDLKAKCKLLDQSQFRAAHFAEPPPVSDSTLVPDLAFKSKSRSKVEVAEPDLFCVRCRVSGHSLNNCSSKAVVCFGCGKKGTSIKFCPQCKKPKRPEQSKN